MVYGLEVGTPINHLNSGSTIYDSKLWTVSNGQTIVSEDWGNTFNALDNNLAVLTGVFYVHFSSNGTMFVCRARQLFRAIHPYVEFKPVLTLSTTASVVRDWGFTEDNDGILYATEYANYPNPNGGMLNIIYWYKSEDDGETWAKQNNLHHFDDKHLHQLKVDPLTNILYATTGDSKKLVFKSSDKGVTWHEVIPTNYPLKNRDNIQYGGHTAIGFFDTGEVLWGTDWKPNHPETGKNWNWYVRSQGDDVDSFEYNLMEKQYYGMYASIATDYHTGRAWASLKDEFAESDVFPALVYTKNKGMSWEPLIALPSTGDLNSSNIISSSKNTVDESPYIFWDVSNHGVVRIPKTLQPGTCNEHPFVPSDEIRYADFFINQHGKIYQIELYKNVGNIKYVDGLQGIADE